MSESFMTRRGRAWIRSGALAAGLLVAGISAALAAEAYTTDDVNLRAGPGTQYAVVAKLRAGTRLDVDGCDGRWCRADLGQYRGWVAQNYVSSGYQPPAVEVPPPVYQEPPVYIDPPVYRPPYWSGPGYWHRPRPDWRDRPGRPPNWDRPDDKRPPRWDRPGDRRPPNWDRPDDRRPPQPRPQPDRRPDLDTPRPRPPVVREPRPDRPAVRPERPSVRPDVMVEPRRPPRPEAPAARPRGRDCRSSPDFGCQ